MLANGYTWYIKLMYFYKRNQQDTIGFDEIVDDQCTRVFDPQPNVLKTTLKGLVDPQLVGALLGLLSMFVLPVIGLTPCWCWRFRINGNCWKRAGISSGNPQYSLGNLSFQTNQPNFWLLQCPNICEFLWVIYGQMSNPHFS